MWTASIISTPVRKVSSSEELHSSDSEENFIVAAGELLSNVWRNSEEECPAYNLKTICKPPVPHRLNATPQLSQACSLQISCSSNWRSCALPTSNLGDIHECVRGVPPIEAPYGIKVFEAPLMS